MDNRCSVLIKVWTTVAVLSFLSLLYSPRKIHAATTYVSFTFDDGRASQLNAAAILNNNGVKGTFYINSAQLGTSVYYLTLSSVRGFAAQGHEIGGHTLTHENLTTASDMVNQICADQQQLQAWGFPAVSFAYPYGAYNTTVQSIVKNCKAQGYAVTANYASARTIGGIQCSGCPAAEPIPPQDPYAVRTSGNSPTSSTTLAQLEAMVTTAEQNGGGWIVIPLHSICSAPSTAPVPGNGPDCKDQYSITYDNLNALVQWVVGRSSLGTVTKTVQQVMQAPPPPSLTPSSTSSTPVSNLVQNPSLETDANADGIPDCFKLDGYGTNTYSYARVTTAHTGSYAESLTITSLSSGDRKLLTAQDATNCTMTATVGNTYRASVWYTANAQVRLAFYYHDSGGWHWWAESPYSPASSSWSQISWTTSAIPSGADSWSFGLAMTSVGTTTVDDFQASLMSSAETSTPTLTNTPTNTPTPTGTPTLTLTPSDTFTTTSTFTPTATFTDTPLPTATFTSTNTFTPTSTVTPTSSFTPTATFTATPSPTATFTPTSSFTPTATFTPTSTFTPKPSHTPKRATARPTTALPSVTPTG